MKNRTSFFVLLIVFICFRGPAEDYKDPLFPFLVMTEAPQKEGDSGFGHMQEELVRWGFMAADGKPVIEPRFSHAFAFAEDFAVVQVLKRQETETSLRIYASWGVINRQGTVVVPEEFERIASFSGGLARARLRETSSFIDSAQTGFINVEGDIVIPWNLKDFNFNLTRDFSEGLAAVIPPMSVKKLREIVTDKQYLDTINNFFGDDEDTEVTGSGNPRGYIDKNGSVAIEPRFQIAGDFNEGLALAVPFEAEKFGFIDRTGEFVIGPQFDDAGDFAEGVAGVSQAGKYGYIDYTGKFVTSPEYDYAHPFSEGKAAVSLGEKFGFIDKQGTLLSEAKYDRVGEFSEGVAAVAMVNDYSKISWGFIDGQGREVIDLQFTGWDPPVFKNGLALVWLAVEEPSQQDWNKGEMVEVKKAGYINKSGHWIYGPVAGPWDIFLN